MIDKKIKWQVVHVSGLLIERWKEKGVVYHQFSGETHQMDDFAISVLELMMKKPFQEDNLIGEINDLFELESGVDIKEMTSQLIKKFDRIGLIEPCYK